MRCGSPLAPVSHSNKTPNRWRPTVSTLGAVVMVMYAAAASESTQRVINGGFEKGLKGWHVTGNVHVERNGPLKGNVSARIGPGEGSLSQLIRIGKGNHFTVLATIQSQRTNDWMLTVRFLDRNGRELMKVDSSTDMEASSRESGKVSHYMKAHPLTEGIELVISKSIPGGTVLVGQVGVQMEDENAANLAPTCDLDEAMQPFWVGQRVDSEAVLMVSEGNKTATGQLMFRPSRIISVRDGTAVTNFSQGVDYVM